MKKNSDRFTNLNRKFRLFYHSSSVNATIIRLLGVLVGIFIYYIGLNWFILHIFFDNNTGVLNTGASGIALTILYTLSHYNHELLTNPSLYNFTYYTIYLVINIPFCIFGFFFVGKWFTMYSVFYILVLQLFSILTLNIHIFSVIGSFDVFGSQHHTLSDNFFRSIIGAIILGIGSSIIYRCDGSTGGTDFFIFYFSQKMDKSIGYLQIFINGAVILLSSLWLTLFINHDSLLNLFNVNLVGTMLLIFANTFTIDALYPITKKFNVEIFSRNPDKIISALKENDYQHTFTKIQCVGTFSNREYITLSTVMNVIEYNHFIKIIYQTDPDVFIRITKVDVKGKFARKKYS